MATAVGVYISCYYCNESIPHNTHHTSYARKACHKECCPDCIATTERTQYEEVDSVLSIGTNFNWGEIEQEEHLNYTCITKRIMFNTETGSKARQQPIWGFIRYEKDQVYTYGYIWIVSNPQKDDEIVQLRNLGSRKTIQEAKLAAEGKIKSVPGIILE